MKTTKQNNLISRTILVMVIAMMLPLVSCSNDNYDEESADSTDGISVELSIQTRAGANDETEVGTLWENYIDVANKDFRIYFFTSDKDDKTATNNSEKNTLIAEFTPTLMSSTDFDNYTTYIMSGELDGSLASSLVNFKVVVLANWGSYPTVTAGVTTIDDLVEGDNTTFDGWTLLSNGVNADNLIPFYGVREYSGVEWKNGWKTTLSGAITLLRAVAKVEVVLSASSDSDITSFDDVSIVGCNQCGYCAPKGVYLSNDYDDTALHLIGEKNDDDAAETTYQFKQQSDLANDTWIAYMAEYDNTSNAYDYSYISVTIDDDEYEIYFADYIDGVTDNTDTTNRYDIKRNNLYQFNVTYEAKTKLVDINITLTVTNQTDGYFNNVTYFPNY